MKVAPSLLSADFANLSNEIASVQQADWLHVDVMDGHFVPNLTMGPLVVKAIRPHSRQFIDVHLMVEDPERWIRPFAENGSDGITVHQEAAVHLHRTLQEVRAAGVKVGVALNPSTPVGTLEHVLPLVDLVLIMTVNPGFGGQSFLSEMVGKVQQLHQWLTEEGLQGQVEIEVDGGVNRQNAPLLKEAGATVLVAGSSVFRELDRAAAIAALRGDA